MKSKRVAASIGAVLIALVWAIPIRAAEVHSLTVTGFVESQVCLDADTVEVTLSATADSSSEPVGFRWDFTNDGDLDTELSEDPTVVTTYDDEQIVTVRVIARNMEGDRARDKANVRILRCG